jgi:hypothetical protein
MKFFFILPALLLSSVLYAQAPAAFGRLPIGSYAVGFKIISFEDASRYSRPVKNYLGEIDTSSQRRKITLHVWYPANALKQDERMSLADYAVSRLQASVEKPIDIKETAKQVNNLKTQMTNFFGAVDSVAWKNCLATRLLARKNAMAAAGKYPLLVGTLRPFSTSITNEFLASHGFIVIMVCPGNSPSTLRTSSLGYIDDVQDMREAIRLGVQRLNANENVIGTFGFSGSGFAQILFAMGDFHPSAVADLESGIYMDGLWQTLSASDYYNPEKLRIPFLHIFSRDLSKQEKYFDEYNRAKFSHKYRLLLNQPGMHHWDFATEGMMSCTLLGIRGARQANIQSSFEIANIYLLKFFQAELLNNKDAVDFLKQGNQLTNYNDTLWSITQFQALKPAPSVGEFMEIVKKKGIDYAIRELEEHVKEDSSTNMLDGFLLNRLGYDFMDKDQLKEAIAIFRFNIKAHPSEPNFHDSLLEALVADRQKDEAAVVYRKLVEAIDHSQMPVERKEDMKKRANSLIEKL